MITSLLTILFAPITVAISLEFTYSLFTLTPSMKETVSDSREYMYDTNGILAHLQTYIAPYPTEDCTRRGGVTTINRFTALVTVSNVSILEIESLENILDDPVQNCSIIPYYGEDGFLEDIRYHSYEEPLYYTYNSQHSSPTCVIELGYNGSITIDEFVGIKSQYKPSYHFHDFCLQGYLEFSLENMTKSATEFHCQNNIGEHLSFYNNNCDKDRNSDRVKQLETIHFDMRSSNQLLIVLSICATCSIVTFIMWAVCHTVRKRKKSTHGNNEAYRPLGGA